MLFKFFNNYRTHDGFTLFEVLIAVLVLSVGLLGIAGLQVTSLSNTNSAYARSIAALLANDMADRIRSNPTAVTAGNFNNVSAAPASPPASGCTSSACTAAEMAARDIDNWYSSLQGLPGGGTGTITGDGTRFTINVLWDDLKSGATGTGCTNAASDLFCFTTTFVP